MSEIVIYYHDPIEVDFSTSWTGLCTSLKEAKLVNIKTIIDKQVTALFDYARPDAVITIDGKPVLSIEQTQMNPSGHNIPQRFSFQVRAAELGIPSILYYPEFSRRTFSDPNVRYLQLRVPLAQKILSKIYNVPALSVFWPTNNETKLPDTNQSSHSEMARVVNAIVSNKVKGNFFKLPEIEKAIKTMDDVMIKYSKLNSYDKNPSVRSLLPKGFPQSKIGKDIFIDPPLKAKLYKTKEFLSTLSYPTKSPQWKDIESKLRKRDLTLVFNGTPNKQKIDSEHPWPGYLTLLDILYLRKENGKSTSDRSINLVYGLPVKLETFLDRANRNLPPTATYIVDSFADLIILNEGVVVGRPMRGNNKAISILH